MSSVKQLKINPDFFKLSRSKSRKNKKSRSISSSLLNKTIKPNDIKKKLLQRIKEHQKKNKENGEETLAHSKVKTFHDEFKESLNYLNGVIETRDKKRKKKTMRNNANSQPPMFKPNTVAPPPPYSCLKGGSKPTYRQYQKTLKRGNIINSSAPKLTIKDKPRFMITNEPRYQDRKNKLNDVKQKLSTVFTNPLKDINIPEPPPNKILKQRNKTLRRKIKLGKGKRTVGVLVKNKITRKKIKKDIDVLKTTKLTDIKSYLKRHNLMKIGSPAPEDVVRKIYEDARLAGSIYNKNPDVLIHNYMTD